ncbi:MAG: cytochrome c oxidase assembly protein [Acidimicrobiia bacterium]|nr:cytochrome c oxidase assembly protein [Acidimicrobiia bacterium]
MSTLVAAESPWVWEPRPDVWLLIAALLSGYWWSVTRLRQKLAEPTPPPSRAMWSRFVAGVVVLWFAVDWPMDRLGDDYLFSAHMVQFLLVTMVAAPLLVSGVPSWLQTELLGPAHRLVRYLARGPGALGLFQVVLVGTHLPGVVALYTSNSLVHFALHALWILSGCLFWLPILGAEPVTAPLTPAGKVVYLIAATIVPTVPAGFLTWAQAPLYDSYASAPRVWGISPVEDLQMAGLIMKLGGGLILWSFILFVFATWASGESANRPGEVRARSTSRGIEEVAATDSVHPST